MNIAYKNVKNHEESIGKKWDKMSAKLENYPAFGNEMKNTFGIFSFCMSAVMIFKGFANYEITVTFGTAVVCWIIASIMMTCVSEEKELACYKGSGAALLIGIYLLGYAYWLKGRYMNESDMQKILRTNNANEKLSRKMRKYEAIALIFVLLSFLTVALWYAYIEFTAIWLIVLFAFGLAVAYNMLNCARVKRVIALMQQYSL